MLNYPTYVFKMYQDIFHILNKPFQIAFPNWANVGHMYIAILARMLVVYNWPKIEMLPIQYWPNDGKPLIGLALGQCHWHKIYSLSTCNGCQCTTNISPPSVNIPRYRLQLLLMANPFTHYLHQSYSMLWYIYKGIHNLEK